MNVSLWPLLKFALVLCLTVATFYATFLAIDIILVSFIGIGIGVLLVPILKKLKSRTNIPRTIGAILIYMLIILIILGVVYWVGSIAVDQLNNLIKDFPSLREKFFGFIKRFSAEHPSVSRFIRDIEYSPNFMEPESITKSLFKGFTSLGNFLTTLLYIAVVGFFTAIRSQSYFEGLVWLFPPSKRNRASDILCNMAKSLRLWFSAQLLDMLVVGVLTSLGLWVIGIKYWLLLGIFTGLFCVVPYIGIAVSTLIATVLVLSRAPDKVIWVWVVYLVSQQLEGNLILPYIMRKRVSMPEVPLLILLFIMVKWFGLLGALMAPPILAMSIVMIRDLKGEELS